MLDKLKEIFKYYKKKYKLKTNLIFNIDCICFFDPSISIISYDIKYTKGYNPIYVLLHEIGHAIDWKKNKEQFKKEMQKISPLYYIDHNQWKKFSFEIRADKFAKKELKRWKNVRKI